jgi:transposase
MGYRTILPLKSLYDFCGFKPNFSVVSKQEIHVDLERTTTTGQCPVCGKKLRWVEQVYQRCIRDLDVSGRRCYLHFVQYKIRCQCGYRGIEQLEFVEKYSRYSIAFEEYVARLCELMSVKDVSELTGVNWKAVKQIDKKYLAKNKVGLEYANPVRIGVDEVSYQKRHKYLTVVRDVDMRRVIWLGEKRKKETLDSFFKELGAEKTAKISVVSMDMWDPFIASVKENCPQAEIVFDKFHVSKKVNEALDKVRKQEFAKAGTEKRKEMKHKRFVILKRNKNLEPKQKEDLQSIMKRNKRLYKAYLLKEQLADILDEPEEKTAVNRLQKWMHNVKRARLPQFKAVLKTIQHYLYGILNYFKHKITNAASEAFNNKIGLLKRRAYGYRDLEYFKLKIINNCWRS